MPEFRIEWVAFPQLDATVVRLREPEYRSLAIARLKSLEARLSRLIEENATTHLVLDLTSVAILGAGFLGVLVRVHRHLRKCGKGFLILAHGEPLNLISLTCLDRLFPVFSTLGEARLGFAEERSGADGAQFPSRNS